MSSGDIMMAELFRSELDLHLPVLTSGLIELEKSDSSRVDINGMMRAAHSVKGAARIVGLSSVVDVAHVLEDCFQAADDKRITLTTDSVDALLAGVDLIAHLSRSVDPAGDRATVERVISRIKSIGTVSPNAGTCDAGTPNGGVPGAATTESPTPVRAHRKSIALPATVDAAEVDRLRRQLHVSSGQVIDLSNVTRVHSSFVGLLSVLAVVDSPPQFVNASAGMKTLLKLANVRAVQA